MVVISFKDIEYDPSKCILSLSNYRVYKGWTWNDQDEDGIKHKKPVAVICITEINNKEDMQDEEAYIKRNFDQACSREKEADRAQDKVEFRHQNLHTYYKIRVDKDKRKYIAAEPIAYNLAKMFDPSLKNFFSHEGENIKYHEPDGVSFEIKKKDLMRQIVDGVVYFHGLGRLHRNLTPDNIFIAVDKISKKAFVKISAFFLSKEMTKDSTASFSGSRTKDWSPREMLSKETLRVGKEVDIFSLGCLFYYILTGGTHPFKFDHRNINNPSFKPEPLTPTPSNESILISRMISHHALFRPTIEEVKQNPGLQDKPYYLLYYHDKEKPKPGLCAIFNQKEFRKGSGGVPELPHRTGSDKDAKKLEETFGNFGFDVRIFEDKTAAELLVEVKLLSLLGGYQSIVLCLLSHGNKKGIFGVDGDVVSYCELRDLFASSPDAQPDAEDPTMHRRDLSAFSGKPKIFLYQACRGVKSQLRLVLPSQQGGEGERVATADHGPAATTGQMFESQPILAASLSDILEVNASLEEYEAYLGDDGSDFIQMLCDDLVREAGTKDFKTVAQDLNPKLKPLTIIDEATGSPVLTRQVIEVKGAMFKKLQLEELKN